MSPTIDATVQYGQQLVVLTVRWFDETPLAELLLVAFVFRFALRQMPQARTGVAPPVVSGAFLLAYFLHRYVLDRDQFQCLLVSVLRSLAATHLVWSVTELIVLVLQTVSRRLDDLRWSLDRRFRDDVRRIRNAVRRYRRWRLGRQPLPPPDEDVPPPPSRAVVLRQKAEAAQADYEAEVAALTGLPLDEDEREILLEQAKQRLLRRLRQVGLVP
jgi:hypothetical protein